MGAKVVKVEVKTDWKHLFLWQDVSTQERYFNSPPPLYLPSGNHDSPLTTPKVYRHGAAVALLSGVQHGVATAIGHGHVLGGAGWFGQASGLSSLQELGQLLNAAAAEELRERLASCPEEACMLRFSFQGTRPKVFGRLNQIPLLH